MLRYYEDYCVFAHISSNVSRGLSSLKSWLREANFMHIEFKYWLNMYPITPCHFRTRIKKINVHQFYSHKKSDSHQNWNPPITATTIQQQTVCRGSIRFQSKIHTAINQHIRNIWKHIKFFRPPPHQTPADNKNPPTTTDFSAMGRHAKEVEV